MLNAFAIAYYAQSYAGIIGTSLLAGAMARVPGLKMTSLTTNATKKLQ